MDAPIPGYWHWVALATLAVWAVVFRMRLTWRSHVGVFLALVWAATLLSWSVSMEPATGNVSGSVVAAQSKRPLAKARVYFPDGERWVRSDDRGRFFLPGVHVGKHVRITVRASGFETSYDEVAVAEGQETKNVLFLMTARTPTFSLYNTERVFAPAEGPSIHLTGAMLRRIQLKIYAADPVRDRGDVQSSVARPKLVERLADGPPILDTVYQAEPDPDGDFSGTVKLDLHQPGLYVARASVEGGSLTRSTWFLITDLGVVTRRAPGEVLFYAQSFGQGSPRSGVALTVFEGDQVVWRAKTGADGTAFWRGGGTGPLTVLAQDGDNYAYVRNDELYQADRVKGRRIYLYSERPIYRPGHEVFFRGIVRNDRDRHYSVAQGTVHVTVKDVQGSPLYDQNLPLDPFGSFTSKISLPNPANLGGAWIEATSEGVSARADFQIAEYRKPEFKVDLTASKPRFNSGEKVRVKVDARYFFGAPVTTAKESYMVYESYYRWDHVQFREVEGTEAPEHYGGMTAQGSLKLDAEGVAWLEFAPGPADHDRDFWVQVDVEDPSHRKVSANTDVLVTLGDFYLSAETDRWGYGPGEAVKVTVDAKDYTDKPRASVPVSATLILEEYHETTDKKGVSHYERSEKEVWTGQAVTDRVGRAVYNVHPPSAGSYSIRFTAPDDGKTIRDARWIYVADEHSNFSYSARDLTLLLDKKGYRSGETARAVVSSTTPNAWVLVCVDARHVVSHQVVHLNGRSATINLPVRADFFPNVTVSATMIHDKQLLTDEKPLPIQDVEKRLKISIVPEKESYEPGQTARVKVTIADAAGHPVQAEFSLGVVDVAIYSLLADSAPDIYDFFYGPEGSLVRTEYSFAPDYSGGRSKEDDTRVRRNFKDTAFWSATLQTDARGQATVAIPLPDNLTTWRCTVRAITKDSLVGAKTADFQVKKPLLVRLEVPRFMAQRDRMEMAAVVHNETGKPQNVSAAIRVEGVALQGSPTQQASIAAGDSHRFAWLVEAPTPGIAKVTVTAKGQGYADAMELAFPILPHGVERLVTRAGQADPESTVTLAIPADAKAADGKLTVYLSPSLAATAMQGLDYLAAYPYGCVEQTMSAFLPDIEVARALKALHMDQPELAAKLPDMVDKGLQRLYDYQHADGGWGWWHDDPTHPYLTAYVVHGLFKARAAGFKIRDDVYQRGVKSLQRQLKEDVGEFRDASGEVRQRTRWNARAYVVYVLSAVGEKPVKETREVGGHSDALNAYTRALLALAYWNEGDLQRARDLLDTIMADADVTETTCHWDTKTVDYSWVDNPVEATANVLRAMVTIDPQNERIDKTVRWLVEYRKGSSWDSTRDTGAVIGVFTELLLAKRAQMSPNYTARVLVNGQQAAEVAVHQAILGAAGEIAVPAAMLKQGDNEIRVVREGSGSLYWSAALTTWPRTEDVAADDQGFAIQRSYAILTPGKGETAVGPGTAIPLGARVRVRLQVTTKKAYPYVMIEDRMASGFEMTVAEAARNWGGRWFVGREVHDDRVCVFATRLDAGTFEMTYDVWAETPGQFHVRPAVAYLMYTPEVRGHSAESRVTVGGEAPAK